MTHREYSMQYGIGRVDQDGIVNRSSVVELDVDTHAQALECLQDAQKCHQDVHLVVCSADDGWRLASVKS